MNKFDPKMRIEHIDRLIRGKPSGLKIGSRNVGHHLNDHELELYRRSLKKGYLELDVRARENLWNVWEKVCEVKKWPFYVLEKDTSRDYSALYLNRKFLGEHTLNTGKKEIKELSKDLAKSV